MLSQTEENYLKAIFKIGEKNPGSVTTNAIAASMETKAASVTDMLKRLSDKALINYEKYKGVQLTAKGEKVAKNLIRKHRLWEVFLVEKLHFNWDQVHEIAEQLEHIHSPDLTNKLEDFLGYPKYDPHGDPIPDQNGNIVYPSEKSLSDLDDGEKGILVGVKDSSPQFLQYLDKINISLGSLIKVKVKYEYDGSREVIIDDKKEFMVTEQVAKNLYIKVKNDKK